MHGLLKLPGVLRRRLKDERGWALIDAVASSAVVVLAFVGTTMAFNGSEASVARDQKKTQAMIVAQNQISEMRGMAQRDISDALALDNTTKTVVYQGTTYNIAFDAYYVTGLGSDQQNACEVSYGSGSGGARFIYMRVKVTYAGQVVTQSGSSNQYLSSPASLDTYFVPDAGSDQTSTGTLRVYVLNRVGNVATGIGAVSLFDPATNTSKSPDASNSSTGCYLFTGLARSTFRIQVAGASIQDLYMTNGSALNKVSQPVVMPFGGALTREVRIGPPVTVTPKFYVNTGSNPNYEVRFVSGKNNLWFGSTSTRPGNWIAATSNFRTAPSTDYAYIPVGLGFMPHISTPTASTLPNAMFPLAQGYSAYAGPCDANDPNAGAAPGDNNFVQVPVNPNDPNWVGSLSYQPTLYLSQIRATYSALSPQNKPTSSIVNGTRYYWNQTQSGAVTVSVRQVADAEGGTTQPRCRSDFNNFNTWTQLPGSISSAGGRLSIEAEALPVGTYDVCMKIPFSYRTATGRSGGTLNSDTAGSNIAYYSFTVDPTDSQPNIGVLGYRSAVSVTTPWNWNSRTAELPEDAGTSCA